MKMIIKKVMMQPPT